ncbi:MAG TPA: molybdopterin dinucleotide binding domain-containing protein, partial [Acidimicrobiales bacterium]|nr:molybdopterin dinucleotide binding domain-containing protein [Acidimicrobiales bacterium]
HPGRAGRGSSMTITGRGPEQQSHGVDTVTAIINLMLALGQVGRRGGGYGCLTGQGNGQGGREHGQKADQLPGYRSIHDARDRTHVAGVWGVDPGDLPPAGLTATEMISRIGEGGLRGLVVAGSNLVVAAPHAGEVRNRLSDLDLLAVMDAFPNETSELADFVLPVTQWAEEDGTMTNLEGRVIRRRAATPPPAGTRSDIEVLCQLATRLGHHHRFSYAGPEEVFDELRRASAGGRADYSGITYERLEREPGVYWPCPDTDHPGTPRLFSDRFGHPDGRARFVAVGYAPSAEITDAEFPVMLTTGRNREQYNSGSQTRRIPRLRQSRPGAVLEMHPELAGRLGIAAGAPVVVRSRRGRATFTAALVDGIRPDTVFAPFHWAGDESVNRLTSTEIDPISRMPEYKLCAVHLAPPSKGR